MHAETKANIEAFRDAARSLLETKATPSRLRRFRNQEPGFERETWSALAEAGWTSIMVPESQGGLGLGLGELLAVVEELGRRPLPEPFVAAGVQSALLLAALPSGLIRDRLLPQVLSGERIVGVAWQEHARDLDAESPDACSQNQGADAFISGTKQWVCPGTGADGWIVVTAGPRLHWVPAATPGLELVPCHRVDGSEMATLHFRSVTVPADHQLAEGPLAAAALARANEIARLAQAAELLGIARQVCEMTIEYLKTRVQFGRPIGANQALQHRMVDAWTEVELAAACLHDVAEQYSQGEKDLARLASRAKARCAQTALRVTRLAIQFHGAIGFTDECDLGLYWKRALHLSAWLGGSAEHRLRHLKLTREDETAAPIEDAPSPPADDINIATLPEDEFRATVRAFLRQHYPSHLRHPSRRLHWHEVKEWYLALSRRGWIAPAWPRQFGGMELPADKLLAFIEEFEDFGVARLPDQGLINLGPVLIRYGTAAQQQQWLPRIIAGEHIWCQGYSEPNAGSDLASLRTQAVLDGDHFVVDGQKIWTTLAQDATHIFLLVRTDASVKKQEGISFMLADLSAPGITVRPIRNIAGEEEFCEVFFDQVRIPKENLVGALNQGWSIAKTLLGFERLFVGSPKTCQHALGQLRALARANDLFADAAFAADYADLLLDLIDLRAAYAHFADLVKRGETLPPSVSLLKIFATETYMRIATRLTEAAGESGATHSGDSSQHMDPLATLFNATITTIYGGSNEIQRNILARQVLGLPS